MYEEPGALPDHRRQGGNQRHQVRADSRLLTVQVARGHRARVRLHRLLGRTVRLSEPAALLPGTPKPQSVRVRVPAESAGTLLAQFDPESGHLLPVGTALYARAATRWILVTGSRTRSSLFQFYRSHTRKHI